MTTNNTEIRTLKDETANVTILPVTVAEAVLYEGKPLTEKFSSIETMANEITAIKQSINSLQTLLTQINEKLNDHTSE